MQCSRHMHAQQGATAQSQGGPAGPLSHLGEDLHGAAGEDQGHVGAQAEQGVELLGLIHGGDLKGDGSGAGGG